MRTRLLAGPDALADYEVLEMLLFLGIPRRDTKPLAKALINQFGSLSETVTAEPAALQRAGLPGRAAEAMALVAEAAGHLSRGERIERPVLGGWAALDLYLDAPARCRRPDEMGVLFLNNRNQLLADECWPEAVTAPGLAREALRRALDLHATALILVRVRPGAPKPAPADLVLHRHVARAAEMLSVLVHDHLILGAGDWISLRKQGAL